MIITLNGDEGAGKSTAGKRLAEALGYKFYYTGQIFRDLAKKRELTLVEYLKLGEKDPKIDREVDDYVVALSEREDDFLIDSRMAWHFIPTSLKIYLKVDEKVGARRIHLNLREKNTRNEVKKEVTIDELVAKIKERRATDNKRYMQYYGVDIHNLKNYDFVLDTTGLDRNKAYEKIEEFVRSINK
jgi:cytidylate kinase